MKLLQNIRRVANDDRGFTLIEVLVVIVIVAILSVGTVGLINTMVNTEIRGRQVLAQQGTVEVSSGWLSSHLAATQRQNIGIVSDDDDTACETPDVSESNDRINPLSVAGDQLVFQSAGKWYRVYYVEEAEQVNVAVADDVADICPQRGPNEDASEGSDAVLDSELGEHGDWVSFNLASGITSEKPTDIAPAFAADGTNYSPFVFYDRGARISSLTAAGSPVAGVPARAGTLTMTTDRGSLPDFYKNVENNTLGSTDVFLYVKANIAANSLQTKTRYYKQNFSFQQVSDNSSAATTRPGELLRDGRVDGNGATPTDDQTIAADTLTVVKRNGTNDLATPNIPGTVMGDSARIEFSGAAVLDGDANTTYEVHAFLKYNGSVVEDAQGRDSLVWSGALAADTPSFNTTAFAGSFIIEDANSGNYQVEIRIKTSSATTSINTAGNQFLDYRVVAAN